MDNFADLLEFYRHKSAVKAREAEKASILWYVLGAIIAAVSVAAIVIALFRFFSPDPIDEIDDFEDDFDDDFFDDEEMENGTGA